MDLRDKAREVLFQNRRRVDGRQFTVPSPSTYPYQWLWDSCFHAIALSTFDIPAAKAEIRSLMQEQLHNGMIPHVIFRGSRFFYPYYWVWPGHETSLITQPPMIAYAVWEVHKRAPDEEFLIDIYPRLQSFYRYFVVDRDPEGIGLTGIINPDESGEDDSPRFNSIMGVNARISTMGHFLKRAQVVAKNRNCSFEVGTCMKDNFWMYDVPMNSILVKNLEILSHIAAVSHDPEGERFALESASRIRQVMRDKLFEKGVFYSADRKLSRIHVDTWAHFAPLFAGLYTKNEARELVSRFLSDEKTLLGNFGVRTVSKTDSAYNPDIFWRGPVWTATNWFTYHGLKSYGFTDEALRLKNSTQELLARSGFREFFNPDTGEGHGARNFTWGSLILDMMEEGKTA